MAQPVLIIQILDLICLVDDVDQMYGLRFPPKHRVDAKCGRPWTADIVDLQFTDIGVRALAIRFVEAGEGGELEGDVAIISFQK